MYKVVGTVSLVLVPGWAAIPSNFTCRKMVACKSMVSLKGSQVQLLYNQSDCNQNPNHLWSLLCTIVWVDCGYRSL